jgi:hypothetical protein
VGVRYSTVVHTSHGALPASCTMGTGSLLGEKRTGRVIGQSPHISTEIKLRVNLRILLHTPWAVLASSLMVSNFFTLNIKFKVPCLNNKAFINYFLMTFLNRYAKFII